MLNKRRQKIEPCGTTDSISGHKLYEAFTSFEAGRVKPYASSFVIRCPWLRQEMP